MVQLTRVLTILITALGLIGCGKKSEPATNDKPESSPQTPSSTALPPGETLENLRTLKIGMSESEVWKILGEPKSSRDVNGIIFFFLEKGSVAVFDKGKLSNASLFTGASLDNPESLK
ncbi:MAG: hypothetical protein K8T89_27085 [Planctomycetes bacterium]|nr:hypothetical protein [Planctomycetota bacterium]